MSHISDDLSTILAELSKLMLSATDTEMTLRRVAGLAQGLAEHCDAVGITLRDGGELVTAACTHELAREIDNVQYEAGKGPCVEASEQLQVFDVPSVPDDSSWPEFAEAATERGITSVLSVPLTFSGQVMGAINLYSREPQAFEHCREVSLIFAAQAATAIAAAQLYEATGKERDRRTPDEALETVRRRVQGD